MRFDVSNGSVVVQQDGNGRWFYFQEAFGFELIESNSEGEDVLRALGLQPMSSTQQLGAKLSCSKGALREKVLVEFPNAELISSFVIDPVIRDDVCQRLSTTGIYALTIRRTADSACILSRHFPIHCANQEDMATGGIAPTVARYSELSLYIDEVTIEQGGPYCQNARLVVCTTPLDRMWQVAGECVAKQYEMFTVECKTWWS